MIESGGICVSDLVQRFGPRTILNGISFSVRPGESVALVGANGAGKTTLLRILSTLLTPSRGEVLIDGISVRKDSRTICSRMGWAPAVEGGFFPRLTGLDNLLAFGALKKLGKLEVLESIDPLEGLAPFEDALETPYFLCSSGMKQLLNLARALLSSPSVLILDEPTRSLDEKTVLVLRELLETEFKKSAILFSAHLRGGSELRSDRLVFLENGLLRDEAGEVVNS